MNTDLSRICSGNTISLQKFVAEENLSLALSTVDNSVEYTYIGVNNSTSLIDHFIVSNSIHTNLLDYYTKDSVDNLSDHIPVCINITCIVDTVPNNPELVMHSKPVWGLVQPDHIYKCLLQTRSPYMNTRNNKKMTWCIHNIHIIQSLNSYIHNVK